VSGFEVSCHVRLIAAGIITEIFVSTLQRSWSPNALVGARSQFLARMQLGVMHFTHVVFPQFLAEHHRRHFFTMNKENFFHGILYVHSVFRQQILARVT